MCHELQGKEGGKSALACGRKADQVDEKPSSHPTHDGGQNRVVGASTATERTMTFNQKSTGKKQNRGSFEEQFFQGT